MDGLSGIHLEAPSGDVDFDLLCQKRESHYEIPLGDMCRDSFFEPVLAESPYVLIWEIQVEDMSDS